MTDDERVDLSPLDPTVDDLRFERAVRAITAEAAPLLSARRAAVTRLGVIATWRRPLWLIAAAVALVAGVSLLRARETTAGPVSSATRSASFADALGVPNSVQGYVTAGTVPSVEQLITTEVRQ